MTMTPTKQQRRRNMREPQKLASLDL
uniref:Uncharacterized protein n=1 Tax=Arundo donax TaxID=35708 RepID=A0A0A8YKH2_ARUDO